MLLDTRSNNNVAFAGISKRMGRHIFIDGKKDICKILRPTGDYKNPKLEEVIKHLNITDSEISETANKYFRGSGNYHDARFDTAATYLTVINGIKKGLIPRNYFTKLLEAK